MPRHCPLCESLDVKERFDKPAGIQLGTSYWHCLNCGHKSLMFPRGPLRKKRKKWWQFWR